MIVAEVKKENLKIQRLDDGSVRLVLRVAIAPGHGFTHEFFLTADEWQQLHSPPRVE